MEVLKSDSLPIRSSEDMVSVRTSVRKFAAELRFGIVDQTKIVTAASEIARNTLDYGRGGDLRMEALSNGIRRGLRLIFTDHGPGIRDIRIWIGRADTVGAQAPIIQSISWWNHCAPAYLPTRPVIEPCGLPVLERWRLEEH